jgi:hypothetical protein
VTSAEIARAYRGGASLDTLASVLRCPASEVRAIVAAHGERVRGRGRPTSPARDLARALLSQGVPDSDIAEQTRLPLAVVQRVRWYARRRAA